MPHPTIRTTLLAASAFALMLGASGAGAQDTGADPNMSEPGYDQSAPAYDDQSAPMNDDQAAYDDQATTQVATVPPANEEIEVIVPRFHGHSTTSSPPNRIALSRAVSYSDLDIASIEGAQELKFRVRDAARGVCRDLELSYPLTREGSPGCYTEAASSALNKADAAIDRARNSAYAYNR